MAVFITVFKCDKCKNLYHGIAGDCPVCNDHLRVTFGDEGAFLADASSKEASKVSPFLANYQAWTRRMWNWQDEQDPLIPLTLRDDYLMVTGLGGETGEALEVLKKAERKHLIVVQEPVVQEHLAEELGDIMYYIAMIADRHGLTLEEIIKMNIEKLEKRKAERKVK